MTLRTKVFRIVAKQRNVWRITEIELVLLLLIGPPGFQTCLTGQKAFNWTVIWRRLLIMCRVRSSNHTITFDIVCRSLWKSFEVPVAQRSTCDSWSTWQLVITLEVVEKARPTLKKYTQNSKIIHESCAEQLVYLLIFVMYLCLPPVTKSSSWRQLP